MAFGNYLRTAVLVLGLAPWLVHGGQADTSGIDFFETRIRPILVEHCYKCHSASAEKLKGELFLDTRAGVLKGGSSGPAIIPGDPEKSLLVKAVRYTDAELQMPPAKAGEKLSSEQIADLEAWIKMGAPDPRTGEVQTTKVQSSEHWAFKPIVELPLPRVSNMRWVQTPVDNFILAKLEASELQPSLPADKRTLIRRASFDLLGLPPSWADVNDFMADKSPEAFAKVVERLLNSSHYGERWGRYWLDVARYADTKGYVFEEERRFPYSYTYRDYVIRAFNQDLPFDRFIIEQLAADLLPLGEDKRPLAALGFLTLGRRFLNNQPDIIDDRIDVTTRGLMGLTVSCARCHDHKYDPIPTQDYYSLYGVFASCNEPNEKPLLGDSALPQEYPQYLAEREKREDELKAFREKKEAEARTKLHSQVGDYLLVVRDAAAAGGDKRESLAKERKLAPQIAFRWKEKLDTWNKEFHPIFGPWFALAALEEKDFASKAKEALANSNRVNAIVSRAFETAPASLKEAAEHYNKIFADVDKQWHEALKAHAQSNSTAGGPNAILAPTALADPDAEAIRQVLYADDSPTALESGNLRGLLKTEDQQKLRALRRKVDELDATHSGSPPRAMALVDNSNPRNARVFKRGNANNPGDEVPRQFLEVLTGPDRKPFEKGSGRLELAQAIASPQNPLTARVIVNRVWMYHFGAPLVRTPGDFGLRSEPPTHPELLDWLAARFIKEDWSLKNLHRWIMLSSTYQQSSVNNPSAAKIDPANQLLWRMNRRRLDFEATRDTLLAVAGKIDLKTGGRPVEITAEPYPARRTVYGFVERQNLPALFRTFDFASPDTASPQRFTTTVPQQALFMMNSPWIVQLATGMVARAEVSKASSENARIERLHQIAYQRNPDPSELSMAREFLNRQAAAETPEPVPWQYGWGEYDAQAQRVQRFEPLPHFNNYSWQGGKELPDPKLGWVLLNAEGGHPGNDQQHAAIRRWIAPRDGVVEINGELEHASKQGDGVRGRVVSSRLGLAGEWKAFNSKERTTVVRLEVKRGDMIDFVTDCYGSIEHDSFTWAPVITFSSGSQREWSAKSDFAGPAKERPKGLAAWEKYAQVLLLANELVFVD